MSDTTLNRFVASGTTAERGAFTPTPPTPASGPDPGYVWFDTDLNALYSWDGANWVAIGGTGTTTRAIGITLDGGGSAITTGIKGDVYVPYACTITAVTMLADQSGSIVIDIWKDTYANYPPTDADSITAAAPPTISAATKSQDTTLTGWTKSIAAGNTLRFNVDSAATVTRVTLILTVTS